MEKLVLSLDQGTTGTTAILWDAAGRVRARVNREHRQYYPQPGWVEHDPEEIWAGCLQVTKDVLRGANSEPAHLVAIGITNQRETVVFWDRTSGRPLAPAIVWQCRRTAEYCHRLKEEGYEPMVRDKTGLLLDPYFSGTKIRWALDNWEAVGDAHSRGVLACGTVDSFLLFRLSEGRVFATDASNASRTLLYNIHERCWDRELLELFGIAEECLPRVMPSAYCYGEATADLFALSPVPLGGVAGDQQAALFGQACFQPGMTKNTYGTGSFILMNTGEEAVKSQQGLLTTIAWDLGDRIAYALEGSIFITGAAVQWLRDGLKLIDSSAEIEKMAGEVSDNGGVFLVPAFAGLGAPHWDPFARGLLIGLSGGVKGGHLARAVIEAMAYQTRDVLEVMRLESGLPLTELRVDGGASVMDLLLQFQADISGITVRRAATFDTTALGAAYLAGLATGFWPDDRAIAAAWHEEAKFTPGMDDGKREALYTQWRRAVKRSLGWIESS